MGLSPAKSTLLNLRFLAESWGHSSGEGSAAFLLETTAVEGGRGGKREGGKGKLQEIAFLCLHWKHQQPKHRGCEDAADRTWSGQEWLQRFIFIQWWPTPESVELCPVVVLLFHFIFCFVGEFPVTLGPDAAALCVHAALPSRDVPNIHYPLKCTFSIEATFSSPAPSDQAPEAKPRPPSVNKILWICPNVKAVEPTRYQTVLFHIIFLLKLEGLCRLQLKVETAAAFCAGRWAEGHGSYRLNKLPCLDLYR